MSFPGDVRAFALTALVTIGFQLVCFFFAFVLQVDTLTDLAGSLNFILIALLSFFIGNASASPRAIALTTLVCISRAELGFYLFYRVLKRGKDARFDEMRGNAKMFLIFWIFQMIWVWCVSTPVLFVNGGVGSSSDALTGADIAGIVVFIVGFVLQVVADFQKDAFRSDAANKEKWCDVGVWHWSRHPNFCGEIFMWWGAFILAASSFSSDAAGWATIVSPLFTMLILLLGSGMPTAEGVNQKRWMKTESQAKAFAVYRARTSPLIPLPPALYAATPLAVKRWLLFELSSYECPTKELTTDSPLLTGGKP